MRSNIVAAADDVTDPAAVTNAAAAPTTTKPQRRNKARNTEHPRVRFIRMAEVCALTGLSPSTVYREEAAGNFPRHVNLSNRTHGWDEAEVLERNARLKAERDKNLRNNPPG